MCRRLSSTAAGADPFPDIFRVPDRVPAHIVIEIDIGIEAALRPIAYFLNIPIQIFLRIVSSAGMAVMTPDIHEIGSHRFGHMRFAPIGKTKGDTVGLQQVEYRGNEP